RSEWIKYPCGLSTRVISVSADNHWRIWCVVLLVATMSKRPSPNGRQVASAAMNRTSGRRSVPLCANAICRGSTSTPTTCMPDVVPTSSAAAPFPQRPFSLRPRDRPRRGEHEIEGELQSADPGSYSHSPEDIENVERSDMTPWAPFAQRLFFAQRLCRTHHLSDDSAPRRPHLPLRTVRRAVVRRQPDGQRFLMLM